MVSGYLRDPSVMAPAARLTEWDALDYGQAGLAHRSWNCTLGEPPPQPVFDGVYSVSVIEHLPAKHRPALLADQLGGTPT